MFSKETRDFENVFFSISLRADRDGCDCNLISQREERRKRIFMFDVYA